MKHFIPSYFWPLTIFQIQGTLCCPRMNTAVQKNFVISNRLCYEACSLYEANTLIVWGSFSNKLADLVALHVNIMIAPRYILHIRGCYRRIDNEYSKSSLVDILPINQSISDCTFEPQITQILLEARQCLRA